MPLAPEILDPASVKQLIEKRNALFSRAINEYDISFFFFDRGGCYAFIRLLEAFSDDEDPVALLVAVAREHIPLNTSLRGGTKSSCIPDPETRQPIDQIVKEIDEQKWYLNQIKYRRTFDEKSGSIGG